MAAAAMACTVEQVAQFVGAVAAAAAALLPPTPGTPSSRVDAWHAVVTRCAALLAAVPLPGSTPAATGSLPAGGVRGAGDDKAALAAAGMAAAFVAAVLTRASTPFYAAACRCPGCASLPLGAGVPMPLPAILAGKQLVRLPVQRVCRVQ